MSPRIEITAEQIAALEAQRAEIAQLSSTDAVNEALGYDPDMERPTNKERGSENFLRGERRRVELLDKVKSGTPLNKAREQMGLPETTYRSWRRRYRRWATAMDAARSQLVVAGESQRWDGRPGSFAAAYFGMTYAWFQLMWINEVNRLPPGSILMSLWPPEHGKTTVFENYANEMLALHPDYRITVATESQNIARKILARVRNRMERGGPTPAYVARFGPFAPQYGGERGIAQPWGADHFNVFRKSAHDERDYSMQALGVGSSIVSTRCDHLHCDDLQSVKTFTPARTDKLEEWFRQDALSRPGEHGKTTIAGTRVGDDDIYERLEADDDLIEHDILKVLKFPAILTDHATGAQRPLFPERYNLDQLERQRRKVGQEAWDRNYMQAPGVSRKKHTTFTEEDLDACKRSQYSLEQRPTPGSVCYVGLDPALGSKNCIIAVEVTATGKLIVRHVREDVGFQRNEQIMSALRAVVNWCNATARVSDVVIESKNFQQGLSRDERLRDMQRTMGFNVSEHLTGINKYDEDIGVPSMASSFISEEILLPWAGDDLTRAEVGELIRQLRKWKPGQRGSRLRQDRVMALWFVWILWRNRWKGRSDAGRVDPGGFKRQGIPWGPTGSGLLVPTRSA